MSESTSTVNGVVKFVKKDRKGVCLEDGKWYGNGFLKEDLKLNKGDKVKLTLNAKGFLMNAEVTEKSKDFKPGSQADPEIRLLVDTGNTLQQAVNLTIAVLNNNSPGKLVATEVLHSAAEACVKEFLAIKNSLETDGVETPKEQENPASDFELNGEYKT